MDSDYPKLVVEELAPDNEQLEDNDSVSIKSYDAKDIAVDCGWRNCKDVSGSPMDAYNSLDGNFGLYPGSVDGEVKMKKPSKTVFEKVLEHFPGSFCVNVTPTFGKQIYTASDGVSYEILTTPAGKLIRIGDKIVSLQLFLNYNCIEQIGGYVQCSNHLDEKTMHSYKISINDFESILLHAAAHAAAHALSYEVPHC